MPSHMGTKTGCVHMGGFKPFNDCVFHFADSLQVCEIFLLHVSPRGQILDPVVISNITHIGKWLCSELYPFYRVLPQ